MNRRLWEKRHFNMDNVPSWPCPECRVGILKLDPSSFKSWETERSIAERKKNPDWEASWGRYRALGVLTCQSCTESVAMVCIGEGDLEFWVDANSREFERYTRKFQPMYFIPNLNLLDFDLNLLLRDPRKCQILEQLESAFGLYWCDNEGCANKLRNVVERILDDQRIRKVQKVISGKEQFLTLNKRIELFRKKSIESKARVKEDVADHLLAIKFIGNRASHGGLVTRKAVLDALEIIEHCLHKLYDNNDVRISRLSKKIVKKRAPIN